MKIEKVSGDIFKKSGDEKRKWAKNVILACVEQGVGVYEVIDDEHLFNTLTRMKDYLEVPTRPFKLKEIGYEQKYVVDIKTKNKTHIYVVVKEKEEQ